MRPVITHRSDPLRQVIGTKKQKATLPDIPRSVPALLRTVIVAVNARGICATHAARLAELPVSEVDHIESLCQCPACCRQRAH